VKLTVLDTTGKELRTIDAADDVFGIEPNQSVMHQAYVAQMSNRRAGNASTLTRGDVRGSTKKIRRQKGLGSSRQGGIRASHHVGGGVAHGPHPHSFVRDLPCQMRLLALRSALSSHASSGTLLVVDGLAPAEIRTRDVQAALDALGVERTALIVSGEYAPALTLAARNIEQVRSIPVQNLNVVDVVNAHRLVMSEDAIRKCEALWGGANLKPARGRKQEAV
jgi:large subunit ribosomal protein L4